MTYYEDERRKTVQKMTRFTPCYILCLNIMEGVKMSGETRGENIRVNKGDDEMGNAVKQYDSLDLRVLMGKKGRIVSSKEALKDVKPIEWGKDVLRGEKRVIVTKEKR